MTVTCMAKDDTDSVSHRQYSDSGSVSKINLALYLKGKNTPN